ncbi:MAG: BA14K family protein [Proteobacteria bacterium]|nr:BA14K family protein [Pseudomonadota bacterium]
MRRTIACGLAALLASTSLLTSPAAAQPRHNGPPPPYNYWNQRRDPPPGHEFRPRDDNDRQGWGDRSQPPPNWNQREWSVRRDWLRRHGHDDHDNNSAAGLIIGTILGFALGAAVVDSQQQQQQAESRLNDPGWIAYCARRYSSFDPYTGTYLGSDGLRHYCR